VPFTDIQRVKILQHKHADVSNVIDNGSAQQMTFSCTWHVTQ